MAQIFERVIKVARREHETRNMYKVVGTDKVKVQVIIDVDAIAKELGTKAYRSKGKKAYEIGGLVRVYLPK